MRAKLSMTLCALVSMVWAVPNVGAAHFFAGQNASSVRQNSPMPHPARIRVERDRGLLLQGWINGRGPYVFAVDTGAGLNMITAQAAAAAGLPTRKVRPTEIAGLSNTRVTSDREVTIGRLAIGDEGNLLPSSQTALVVSILPSGIDGVLDPTRAFSPFGYSIDMPNRTVAAMDGTISRARRGDEDGATVSWLRAGSDGRPFVRLGDGRLALVDTGSGFGLAVNGRDAVVVGGRNPQTGSAVRDIGGGAINSRRVAPTTVSIGDLVLRGVPTDILYGIDNDVPVILGRDALYPFKITFDPRSKLIAFVAAATD